MKKYKHLPSGKIFTVNGAGGLINENCSASIPLWLRDNSKDFIEICPTCDKPLSCSCNKKADKPSYTILSYTGNGLYNIKTMPYSVRRESDGEVFTIGDKYKYYLGSNARVDILDHFVINNYGMPHNLSLSNKDGCELELYAVVKVKEKVKILTTEDGVDVFDDYSKSLYYVEDYDLRFINPPVMWRDKNMYGYDKGKWFSTEKLADEWIVMNKPCLSIIEFEKILADGDHYNNYQTFLKKLKALVNGK